MPYAVLATGAFFVYRGYRSAYKKAVEAAQSRLDDSEATGPVPFPDAFQAGADDTPA